MVPNTRTSVPTTSIAVPPRSKPGAWPPRSKSSASRSRSARCRKPHDTKLPRPHELVALPGACGTVRRHGPFSFLPGRYKLHVSGFNYIPCENTVDIEGDVATRVELAPELEGHEDYR